MLAASASEKVWQTIRRAAVLAAVSGGQSVRYLGEGTDLMEGMPGTRDGDDARGLGLLVCEDGPLSDAELAGLADDATTTTIERVPEGHPGSLPGAWVADTALVDAPYEVLADTLREKYDSGETLDLGGLRIPYDRATMRIGTQDTRLLGDTIRLAGDEGAGEVVERYIGALIRRGHRVWVLDACGDLPADLHTRPGVLGVSRQAEDHEALLAAASLPMKMSVLVVNGESALQQACARAGVPVPRSRRIAALIRDSQVAPRTAESYNYVVEGDRLRGNYGRRASRNYLLPRAGQWLTEPLPTTGDRTRAWVKIEPGGGYGPLVTLTEADGQPIPERAIYDPHSPEYIGRAPQGSETQEGPTPRRTVRVPDTEWEAAQRVAEEQGESLSEVVRRLLGEYVAFADGRAPRVYRAVSTSRLAADPVVVEGITGHPDEVRAAFPAAHWRVEYRETSGYLPL